MRADLQLRDASTAGGQLAALVHYTHASAETVRELTHEVPQQGGFSAAGRSGDQRRAGLRPQASGEPVRAAGDGAGQTQVERLELPDACDPTLLHAYLPADAEAMPARKGQKAAAELILYRVNRAARGAAQQLLELYLLRPERGALP